MLRTLLNAFSRVITFFLILSLFFLLVYGACGTLWVITLLVFGLMMEVRNVSGFVILLSAITFSPMLLGFYPAAIRKLRPIEGKESLTVTMAVNAASVVALFYCFMVTIWLYFFISPSSFGVPTPIDLFIIGEIAALYIAENALKVLLFDFLEIFKIKFTIAEPNDVYSRAFIFTARLLMSVTIAAYIADLLNYSKYPIDDTEDPSK